MRYVTTEEVASYLERRIATVEDWLPEGRLPSLRIQGLVQIPMAAIWPWQRVSESDE